MYRVLAISPQGISEPSRDVEVSTTAPHEPRRAPEVVEGGVIEIMVNRRGGPDTGDVSVTVNVAESGGDRVASGDEGRRTVTLERGFENAQYRSTYYLRIPTRATGGGDGRLVVTVEDGTGYTVGEQSRVTVKLIDRAAPTPTVTLRAVRNSAPEGEDLEFTLTRTGAVEGALRVGVEDGFRPNPNRRCLAPIPATPPNDDAHGDGTASGGRLLCKWPLSCINITLPSNT